MASEVEKEERRQARLRSERNFKKNFGFKPSNGCDENRKKIETALVKKVLEKLRLDFQNAKAERDQFVENVIKNPRVELLAEYDEIDKKIWEQAYHIDSLGKDANIMGFIIPGINDHYHD
jgi:hypothetical protein